MPTKKPKRTKAGAAEVSALALTGAGAYHLASIAPASISPSIAAFFAVLPGAVSIVLSSFVDVRRRMAATWWKELVRRSRGKTAIEIAAILEANAHRPWVHETMTESIKGLLVATDPAVAPAMGAIAARYLNRNRRPDSFFRDLTRVLCELSEEEYLSFKGLMRRARGGKTTEDEVFLFSWKIDGRSTAQHRLPHKPGQKHEYATLGQFRGLLKLFRLLKANGLGAEMPTGGHRGRGGPNVIRMYAKTVRKICRHIG